MKLDRLKLEELTAPTQLMLIELLGESFYRERLLDMGFRPGIVVEFLGRIPFSGPFLLKVQGAIISLRQEEAACLKLTTTLL
jgi:Fe2+ transport system protein FeoA